MRKEKEKEIQGNNIKSISAVILLHAVARKEYEGRIKKKRR